MNNIQKKIAFLFPKYCWVIPFLVISPAALLIPNDVFTQYPWARTYTDWLAPWIPMIDRAAHLHPHPDKFRAFFAYAWSWLPAFLFLVYFSGRKQIVEHTKKMLAAQVGTTISMAALCCWVLFLVIYAPFQPFGGAALIDRHDMRVRLYCSDWALLWSGPLQVWATCGFILVVVSVASGIRTEIYAIKTPGQDN